MASKSKKTAKRSTRSKSKAADATVEAPVKAVAAPVETASDDMPVLRKPDFIDRVVSRSGGKKKDVKPAVEAALAVLGEALANGEELNLPPFGKVKVTRSKDAANAKVIVCRLRRPHNMTGGAAQNDAE